MDFNEIKETNTGRNIGKNRLTLIAMAVIFVAPVLLAYLAYFGGWFVGGGKSHGEIIAAPWHIDDLRFRESSFGDWAESPHLGKWNWMLVLNQSDCNDQCQINWFLLQQSWLGLNKNAQKTGYFLVLSHPIGSLNDEWKSIELVSAEMVNGNLPLKPEQIVGFNSEPMPANAIYLIDPLGNIFMRYTLIESKQQAPFKSKELRDDLNRVLKYLDVGKKND